MLWRSVWPFKFRTDLTAKHRAVKQTVLPEGNIEACPHLWLCTSPIHYRDILADVMMHYTSDPGSRFANENIPLSRVQYTLEVRGY